MAKTIEQVNFSFPLQPKATRVAAYARVSRNGDAMLHSLSQQVSYYSQLIQEHQGWVFCGVYADEGKTGTKESREQFQKLLIECRTGNIDIVITKSISRFARNTITLLETVRELKSLGIDVFFEEQNIHTMSSDGELMLTILASYAQEESRSVSENMKWRIKKNFEAGMPWNGRMLGYRYDNGKLIIVKDEAKIVRSIFEDYLSGKGLIKITHRLTESGVPTTSGKAWDQSTVSKILRNYAYTGNLLLQKTYRENHISKKKLINEGQLPKYHAFNTHEPIISLETFNAVQVEIERRAKIFSSGNRKRTVYPFSGIIVCEKCEKNYRRKITATGPVWICDTFNTHGKKVCASKQIPEITLEKITADLQLDTIEKIIACDNNILIFCFKDGSSETRRWKDRSRSESWTPEMKEEARKKKLERNKN